MLWGARTVVAAAVSAAWHVRADRRGAIADRPAARVDKARMLPAKLAGAAQWHRRQASTGRLRSGCGPVIGTFPHHTSVNAQSPCTHGGMQIAARTSRCIAEGRRIRGDQRHSMLEERIASRSEVIRAIVSGDSPLWGARTCSGHPAWRLSALWGGLQRGEAG